MPQDYLTVRAVGEDEFVEKKSRFIGLAAPVKTADDALAVIESVRKKHPMPVIMSSLMFCSTV